MSGRVKVAMTFAYVPAVGLGVPDFVVTCHAEFKRGVPLSPPTDGDVDTLIAAIDTAWWAAGVNGGRSLYATTIKLMQITGQYQTSPLPSPRLRLVNTGGTDAVGNVGQLPPQVAVGWSERTAVVGRSFRGRMYMPACDSQYVSGNGGIVSAYQSRHADSADVFRAAVNTAGAGGDWTLCVYSRQLDVLEPVLDINVGNRVDTQRRRLPAEQSYVTT